MLNFGVQISTMDLCSFDIYFKSFDSIRFDSFYDKVIFNILVRITNVIIRQHAWVTLNLWNSISDAHIRESTTAHGPIIYMIGSCTTMASFTYSSCTQLLGHTYTSSVPQSIPCMPLSSPCSSCGLSSDSR